MVLGCSAPDEYGGTNSSTAAESRGTRLTGLPDVPPGPAETKVLRLDGAHRKSTFRESSLGIASFARVRTTDQKVRVRVPSGASKVKAVTSINVAHGLLRVPQMD